MNLGIFKYGIKIQAPQKKEDVSFILLMCCYFYETGTYMKSNFSRDLTHIKYHSLTLVLIK